MRPSACLLVLALLTAACRRPAEAPEFVVAFPYGHDTLDPHGDGTLSTRMSPSFSVYEALVDVDADLRVRPGLAHAWSTVDDRRWLFDLREARFHSGRPLTPADVVFSLRRAAGPQRDTSYYLQDLESVREVGPRTVELRTRGPAPRLLNRLGFVMIVPAGSGDLSSGADGTGPYRVKAWEKGRRLSLARHEGWWRGTPAIEAAAFVFGTPGPDAEAGLLGGRFQMAQFVGSFHPEKLARSTEHRVIEDADFYVTYLAWNVRRAPFSDHRVREAVALAVDRAALVARLPRRARAASQLVSSNVFGFDPALAAPRVDLRRAQALLAGAGFRRGLESTLTVRERYRDAGALLRDQLAPAGIRLRLEVEPDARYFDRLQRQELQLWMDNWGCTTGDAAELFENALHSPGAPTGYGRFNETGYGNPEVDRRVAAATRLEGDERRELLQEIMRIALADHALLPLFSEVDAYGLRRRLEWRPRADTAFRLADIRVD